MAQTRGRFDSEPSLALKPQDILLDHLRGKIELSQTQVNTGFGLLKKILPDFSNSAPPRDDEEKREDGASSDPEFEVHIVDPKEA